MIFAGDYLAALGLRLLVRGREDDAEQLRRWVDALVALPFWGSSEDPDGLDHNNDLSADFNMLGLSLALNWHAPRLGPERVARVEAKLAYQAEEMFNWVVRSRSSWPGAVSQNHAYFGHQTLLLAGLALHDRHDKARVWLDVAAAAFRRFAAALPPDGSYHEGLGYIPFALTGLMPSLMLLQQFTGETFIPENWLAKHWPVVETLLPEGESEGFFIDDCDGGFPVMLPLALWEYARRPAADPVRRSVEAVLARFYRDPAPTLAKGQLLGNFWSSLWAPELAKADFRCAARPKESALYLSDSGGLILGLGAEAKAYFLSGPAHGYQLFGRETHTYSYGHHHPDSGNILLNCGGQWVLADTGYTWAKRSAEHNVLLVDRQGQHNDGHVWMAPPPFDFAPPRAQLAAGPGWAKAAVELEPYYPRTLPLTKWRRTVIGVYGKGLVIVDEVRCRTPAELTISWGSDQPWTRDGDGRYVHPTGCRLVLSGAGEVVASELIRPARRSIDSQQTGRPWHVLRVRPEGQIEHHRFTALIALPGVTEDFGQEFLAELA